MRPIIRSKSIFLIFTLIFLNGCATNSYTDAPPTLGVLYSKYVDIGYDGDIKPFEEVGVVTTDGIVKVQSVDGKSMDQYREYKTSGFYPGGRYQLHLLPGLHTLTLSFHYDKGTGTIAWSKADIPKVISISAGQVIHISWSDNGSTWKALESDGSKALTTIKSDYAELTKGKL